MSAKKKLTQEQIISFYMDDVLSEESLAQSVYAFAKRHNFEESEFYQFFNGFDHLQEEIFAAFGHNTISMIQQSDDYAQYETQQKLLSFYFTFFELLTANRSYVMAQLSGNKDKLSVLKSLGALRRVFVKYIEQLGVVHVDFKSDQLNKLRDKGVAESMWMQLLVTLKFWMEDRSKGFEKTDIFIEKSIKAQFDLIDTAPVQSVFDLAKFLWKENSMV
ncbi:TetR family transcriptional regulator C-terminal domain-containing protein [Flavobacteriaceae bacterium]|nr:TetR family transcriptional regulator C-terminal domain-containing protein [Flavobacteriaceae bacterium]